MKKTDIKNAIGKLSPDKGMEHRLSEKILQKQRRSFPIKHMASIAASLVVVVSLGILGHNFIGKRLDTPPGAIGSTEGIYIPKLEIPEGTDSVADMIGLIVYQGRIYTQTGTKISAEDAEKLIGNKLGTTKGNINEWSKQKEYAVEFASTIGKGDVYSVKGYDKAFRIMVYEKTEGNVYAEFYECLNGITVKTGADIFGKLNIEDNIKAAKYESYESYYYSKQQYKELTEPQVLSGFVKELNNTLPYSYKSLSYLWDEKEAANRKFVYITLKDGSEVQLMLFKEGYIHYSYSHIFFKMEKEAFHKLWEELE
jgi:hypothetical protein